MRIQTMPTGQLTPAEYNPRVDLKPGDPEYEKLKRSVEEFGFVEPIVWNERSGRVIGGHQRLKVLAELGYEEVEVSVVDLDDEREKALNFALNKIEGDWDRAMLKDLLEELDTGAFDMELTGFDTEEIEELMTEFYADESPPVREDDFDADGEYEEIQEPITRRGDIWRLGKHRLLCGSATDPHDIDKLMDGQLASMVFTDPPYNVDYVGKTKDALKIENDHMDNHQFYQFLYDAYKSMLRATRDGGAIYVCHADSEGVNFRTAMVDAGYLLKQSTHSVWRGFQRINTKRKYHDSISAI